MTTTGFVRLGSMGAALAGRLLPDNPVYGTNRTRARARALIQQGRAEEQGYGHRDIAGLFQVLAAAPGPGRPAATRAGAGPGAA